MPNYRLLGKIHLIWKGPTDFSRGKIPICKHQADWKKAAAGICLPTRTLEGPEKLPHPSFHKMPSRQGNEEGRKANGCTENGTERRDTGETKHRATGGAEASRHQIRLTGFHEASQSIAEACCLGSKDLHVIVHPTEEIGDDNGVNVGAHERLQSLTRNWKRQSIHSSHDTRASSERTTQPTLDSCPGWPSKPTMRLRLESSIICLESHILVLFRQCLILCSPKVGVPHWSTHLLPYSAFYIARRDHTCSGEVIPDCLHLVSCLVPSACQGQKALSWTPDHTLS